MAVTLQMNPLVFAHQRAGAGAYAYAVAAAKLVARGPNIDEALAELSTFLTGWLEKVHADELARFVYPADAALAEIEACIERPDLARRIQITSTISLPTIVIPDGPAKWVHILPLRHTVYVAPEHAADARWLEGEITRIAGAQELTGQEYLALLPGDRHVLRRLDVQVSREDVGDLGRRARDRRQRQAERETERAHELLASVGVDLGAGKRAPTLHRDPEIGQLRSLLGSEERLCVAIVGERSAGKTAVVHGLMTTGGVGDRKVYATSGAQLVAGQSGFGQLEQRIHDVMAAAERLDAVLFFDDFGDLLAGHGGSIEDMASAMRPWIVDGRVRVVGELTPDQLEHFEKRQVGLFSALQRISIEPLSVAATIDVLRERAAFGRRTEPSRPVLDPGAIEPLVQLAQRYLSYEAFPGKAVQLSDELRAIHEGEVDERGDPVEITAHDVYAAFAVRSGIPTFLLRDDTAMRRQAVIDFFAQRVIGQSEAIEGIADTLCTVKAGLAPGAKPLASFLFIGPTGVGKTEVAKTLARFLFGSASRLSRFDMSEYMDPLAAERLIRGTERDEGELTRRVRQQPFCVVLLDEIEKAHRAVFDLLLQVCGEGRLSDARGRTTYFHNAIIIMTSNLGAAHRRPATGFGAADESNDAAYFLEQVERNFRPEFVNRLDRVVPFAALTREEIRQVSRVAVDRVREREGIALRGITLDVSDAALDRLAEDGFSDAYGARALRRHLEAELVGPLAEALSAHAREAQLARIDVTVAGEPAPSSDAQLVELARRSAGPVQVLVRRPVAASARSTEHVLAFVGHLRRQARRCVLARPLAEMRERLEYMIAELAQPGADIVGRPTNAAEFDRIKRLLNGVDEAMESIEAAEDLCLAAQAEGEDPSAYGDEALAAFARFEHAWVEAVSGQNAADRITVMARPIGTRPAGRELFRRWLRGWLEYAHVRGWEAIVHRFEDPQTDVTWPTDYPWGPPRTRAWALERLEAADDDELGKQWRGVVLRLRGPLAGGLMQLELGVHRHGDGADAEHVQVRMGAPTDQLSAEMWHSAALQLPKPPDPSTVAKMQAAREFLGEDSMRLPALGQLFDVGLSDYWDNHMRIVFSILADKIAREED